MILKLKEKEKAIKLRKKGFSYSEILKEIPVAKSTLSLWLRSVGLAKKQKQRLTEKRLAAALRGAQAKRNYKEKIIEEIKNKARREIKEISNRELWLMGIALYWAEGIKEKIKSSNVKFSNSDPRMIKLFLKWLQRICKIPKQDIFFEIYLHKTAAERENEIKQYWSEITTFPLSQFTKIRWKKHNLSPKRKNIGKKYYGQLRINVRKSSTFNRKIAGWVEGICQKNF
jgi:hypothetical protein